MRHRLVVASAAALAAVAVGLYQICYLPLNHDAAWALYLSRAMLRGARLYVDYFEINPPLIIWLGVPVVLLEKATGISHIVLFQGLVALGAAVSLVAAHGITGQLLPEPHRRTFALACGIVLFLLPATDWGQREHILLILTLPYVLACASRARGLQPPRPVLVGVAGAVGFALKPHFLPAFLALELWLLLSKRPVWTGAIVAAVTMALYGAATILFTEYLPAALQLRHLYSAYSQKPLSTLILHPATFAAAASLACLRVRGAGLELRSALAIATVAWTLGAVVQAKGFEYHFMPALGGVLLLLIAAVIGAMSGRESTRVPLVATLVLALVVVGLSLPTGQPGRWSMIREGRQLIAGRDAIVLSMYFEDVWPLVSYADARWAAPLPSAWPVVTGDEGGAFAARSLEPALIRGVDVLVPTDASRNALPILMRQDIFRRAWAAYRETARGQHFTLFRHTGGLR